MEHKETPEEERDSELQEERSPPSSEPDAEKEVASELPLPPDGGWGWVVLAASFLCNAMVDGMASCFGALMPHLADYYQATTSQAALVGSIMIGSYLVAGPLVGAFVNYYGGRVSAMFGAGLAASGLLLSVLSPSINVLILTYGLIGGVGICFFYIPAMVMVGYYFERRRALAMGISSSGAGIGMLVFAPMTAYFLEVYDWKNTVILLAGVLLQVLVLGALLRPLELTKFRKKSATGRGEKVDNLCDIKKGSEDSDYHTGSEKSNVNGATPKDHTISDESLHTSQNVITKTENGHKPSDLFLRYPGVQKGGGNPQLSRSCDFAALHLQSSLGVVDTSSLLLPGAADPEEKAAPERSVWYSYHDLPGACPSRAGRGRPQGLRAPAGPRPEAWSPVLRRDVFYSGSVHTLPEYRAQPDQASYLASMLEPAEGDPPRRAACPGGGFCGTLAQMLDPGICLNPSFVILGLGAVFIQLGYFIPIVYMTEYCATIGLDAGRAAILISVMGVSNMIGRAGAGALANLPCVNALHLCNISLLITGGSTILAVSFCRTFPSLIVYSIVFGISLAAFVPLTSIFLVQYIGLHKLTNAFGLLSMVRGLSSMAGPPIAGAILDATSSFHSVFYFGGSMFIIAGIVHYFLPCTKKSQLTLDVMSP